MTMRDVIPNTRRAHEATEFARAQGRLEPFHAGLLTRYWTHGEDIHDWAVLEAAARDAGLDAAAMHEEVDAGKWKGAVDAFLREAAELGVHAVPTFLIGGRFVIQGAQDALVFRHAFERLKLVPEE